MKILVNLTTLTNSGILIIWLKKFQELSKLNNNIDILYGNSFLKKDLKKIDIYKFNRKFLPLNKLPKIKTKLGFLLMSILKNFKSLFLVKKISSNYDCIYSPSSVLDLIILPFFVKKYNRKIIWSAVFDNIVPITDPGNKIIRFLAWIFFQISLILLKKADIIFVISQDLKDFLVKKGFSSKKIVLTGNAIENELIKKAKKSKKYHFDALFIGRINETKGIFDMLKVLKIITKKFPKFNLAIMGEGDNITKNKFQKKIKQLNLQKNIQFLGYKTGIQKFNIIKSSKCFWFLSVSQSESFGIALMEAVCCGLPSFTYDLKPFNEIYQNNEINISPKGDYRLVAKKVIKLFDNKNFDNKNGKKLLDKYSWEKIAEKEYSAFKKLL